MKIDKEKSILVTGHSGMVGKRLVKKLSNLGYSNILTASIEDMDLRNQKSVDEYFINNKPNYVIHLAAKVGGILPNIKYSGEFIYDNLMIQTNVIHAAHKNGCEKLVFMGSSCIYPKECDQPMKEEYFMTGKLEPTNQSYAVAKIAGIQMCQGYNAQYGTNFISIMPCNLYGPGDHFSDENSHVMAALISRFHEAKKNELDKVIVWGSGLPRREFLFVDDIVSAILFLFKNYDESSIINVGAGYDISIKNLAFKIKTIVGFEGKIEFDTSKPDGMMKKLLDTTKINNLGWKPNISLDEGIKASYEYFLSKMDD